MKCLLCGLVFERETAELFCASQCPLSRHCDLVRCPNCYYESVAEPRAPKVQALPDWPKGKPAVVTRLAVEDNAALRKILAMGVLPSVRLKLVSKSPSFVFELEERRFSIDRELASRIYVAGEKGAS